MMFSAEDALRAQEAGFAKAKELGVDGVLVIMDDGANMVSLLRMEGAPLAVMDIAIRKAYTAAAYRQPSSSLMPMLFPEKDLSNITLMFSGKLISVAGGLPIMRDGVCIGSIGFSGGPPPMDVQIVEAGIAALLNK